MVLLKVKYALQATHTKSLLSLKCYEYVFIKFIFHIVKFHNVWITQTNFKLKTLPQLFIIPETKYDIVS